jgi:hypothetical protein
MIRVLPVKTFTETAGVRLRPDTTRKLKPERKAL